MAQNEAPAVLHPDLEEAVLRLGPLLEHRYDRVAPAQHTEDTEKPTRSEADPNEMKNLAANRELVAAMNEKLNRLIDAEVGEDRGQMLPGGIDAGWEINRETMAP